MIPEAEALYIHVPFCARKCAYCDFYSRRPESGEMTRYTAALRRELALLANAERQRLGRRPLLHSVYYGGGTPSLLPGAELARINEQIAQDFELAADLEWTLEANPSSLDREKAEFWHVSGINRLSLGLQSSSDHFLKILGRLHDWEGFKRALETALAVGFPELSVDLIFGLPGESLEDFAWDLDRVLQLPIQHLSCYSLILEEGTPFAERYARHPEALPAEQTEREMYHLLCREGARRGFHLYEISNLARPGHEARHNTTYWRGLPYYAAGPAASAFWQGRRLSNPSDLGVWLHYYEGEKAEAMGLMQLDEALTAEGLELEFFMLGFRLCEGVREAEFNQRFGHGWSAYEPRLTALAQRGLIRIENEVQGQRCFLTELGLDLANQVFAAFLSLT